MFLNTKITIAIGVGIIVILMLIGVVQIIREIYLSFITNGKTYNTYTIIPITDQTKDAEQELRTAFSAIKWRDSQIAAIFCETTDNNNIKIAEIFARERDIPVLYTAVEIKDFLVCKKI